MPRIGKGRRLIPKASKKTGYLVSTGPA